MAARFRLHLFKCLSPEDSLVLSSISASSLSACAVARSTAVSCILGEAAGETEQMGRSCRRYHHQMWYLNKMALVFNTSFGFSRNYVCWHFLLTLQLEPYSNFFREQSLKLFFVFIHFLLTEYFYWSQGGPSKISFLVVFILSYPPYWFCCQSTVEMVQKFRDFRSRNQRLTIVNLLHLFLWKKILNLKSFVPRQIDWRPVKLSVP